MDRVHFRPNGSKGSVGWRYHTYDVSLDQRFLVVQRVLTAGAAAALIGPEVTTQGLTVTLHWTAALKK